MRTVCCVNNFVGLQVPSWLGERNEDIAGIIIHPQKKQKCGREIITASGLSDDRIFYGDTLGDKKTLDAIRQLKPDIAVSVYFGYLFRKSFLDLFPQGCINLHPAFLPYNRGAYPNVWSIIDGTPSGTTLHYVNEGIDTGDIIAQKQIAVKLSDTGETLYHRLESASLDLFKETWPGIARGDVHPIPQPTIGGTYHNVRDVETIDEIDLNRTYTARELINILRARSFPPNRGAYIQHNQKKIYVNIQFSEENKTV